MTGTTSLEKSEFELSKFHSKAKRLGLLNNSFGSLLLIVIAFVILFFSLLRSASVKYDFGISPTISAIHNGTEIDYALAYPGRVLPDSSLWPVKALRDKIWLFITTDRGKKSDLLLLFADKRVAASINLFKVGKAEIGFATLEKSQSYLSQASELEKNNRAQGMDTNDINLRLAKASLKHYEVMESLLPTAPEDARPKIIELQNSPRKVYEEARNALLAKGVVPPKNPFDWR